MTSSKRISKGDSYFKIKSGLFGTKVKGEDFEDIFESEVDSTDATALKKELEDKKKKEAQRKTKFAKYKRQSLARKMRHLFYMEDTKLNFVLKSRKYEYRIANFTYLGEDAVYILDFEPKGSAELQRPPLYQFR